MTRPFWFLLSAAAIAACSGHDSGDVSALDGGTARIATPPRRTVG